MEDVIKAFRDMNEEQKQKLMDRIKKVQEWESKYERKYPLDFGTYAS